MLLPRWALLLLICIPFAGHLISSNSSVISALLRRMKFRAVGLGLAVYAAVFGSVEAQSLQEVLQGFNRTPGARYPTDLTRGILPKPLHSHNDYWRDVPLYEAISVGAISVEADVWLVNDTLYVGHELSALTPNRTFDGLYVDPLMSILARQNPVTPFVTSPTKNGVFDTNSAQTLYLYIDMKTSGPSTFLAAQRSLQPLIASGYLTTVSSSPSSPFDTLLPGPITVIGTGNTPLTSVEALEPRYIFYDAPLYALSDLEFELTPLVSPFASTSFNYFIGPIVGGKLNESQVENLQWQIGNATARGIKARYWDTPAWPTEVKEYVWRTLLDAGVGVLNVDDLQAGASF